jgi:hypothetical protein
MLIMFTFTLLTGTVIQAHPTFKSKCSPKQSYKAPSPQAAPSTTFAQPTQSLPVCDQGFVCVIGDATFNQQTEQATTVPENCGIEELSGCSFECTAENCSNANGELKSGLSELTKATCGLAIATSTFVCPTIVFGFESYAEAISSNNDDGGIDFLGPGSAEQGVPRKPRGRNSRTRL